LIFDGLRLLPGYETSIITSMTAGGLRLGADSHESSSHFHFPGFVPTEMTSRYYRRADGTIDEDLREMVLAPMRKFAPLGRVGEPADITYCVLYLASDASSFLTGQCLSPNGGVAMP